MSQFHFLLMSLSAFFSFTFIFLNSLLFRFFLAKFFTSSHSTSFLSLSSFVPNLTYLIPPSFFLFSSSCLLNYLPLRFLLHFLVFLPAYLFQLNPMRYLLHFYSFFSSSIPLSYISFFHVSFTPFLIIFFIISYLSFSFFLHFIFISILFLYCKILLLL